MNYNIILIFQIDKNKLNQIAQGTLDAGEVSLMKLQCDATHDVPYARMDTLVNGNQQCVLDYRPPVDGDKEACKCIYMNKALHAYACAIVY